MAINPHFQQTGEYRFSPIPASFPKAPGTVDELTSCLAMLRITCLLGAACFVCDFSSRRDWRRRVWRTIAGTGISLVLFGLVQSAFAQPLFVWSEADRGIPYFATYYYHGNAGSFINLVLPFVAGLAALTLSKPDEHFARAIWFPGFFICVAGAFVNLSRSAMVISGLLCTLLLGWQFAGKSRNELLPPRRLRVAYVVVLVGAVACLVAFSGWERPAEKWAMMEEQLNSSNKRLISTRVCLRMLPDAGWHGFGPGTFALVFPHYTGDQAKLIPGIWRYAHDDYLQTLLEWGWFGSIFWAVVFFGAIVQLFIHWRKRRDLSTSDRVLAFVTGLALLGVALHAVVDFPLQIASLQLYAAVCVGFGWGCRQWEGTLHHSSKSRPGSHTLPIQPSTPSPTS
jgi:NADH:ubiquinone oxidoreductase subunit 6 (subunit J)